MYIGWVWVYKIILTMESNKLPNIKEKPAQSSEQRLVRGILAESTHSASVEL